MATLIRFTGEVEEVFPADRQKGFSIGECYTLIGCDIVETVMLRSGEVMIIDEEAKLKDGCTAKFNPQATRLLVLAGGMPDDWICGNALICKDKEFQ